MRWEDVVKNDVEELRGGTVWKTRATDRDGWKAGCMTGIVLEALIPPSPTKKKILKCLVYRICRSYGSKKNFNSK